MNAPLNIDDLLRRAGRHQEGAAAVEQALKACHVHADAPDDRWRMLEEHLQATAQARLTGAEPPGAPAPLMKALEGDPLLRRALADLALPVAQAVAGTLPRANQLPPALKAAIHDAALADARRTRGEATPTAAAPDASPAARLGTVLSATVQYLRQAWQAIEVGGLSVVQPEMILARGAGNGPVAMQGMLEGRYLVAFSLSGDPTRQQSALDAQCQEVAPGSSTPRPIPSFCLRDEQGRRFHSRDRIARVEPITLGEHAFTLEVLGRPKGTIVLNVRG